MKPTDVAILNPGIGKNLTLFTCTPIGGINGRWVVQAKFIDEEKVVLEEQLYGTLLAIHEKKEIQVYHSSLKSLSRDEQKINLEKKFAALSLLEDSPYKRYYLLQVARIYGEL